MAVVPAGPQDERKYRGQMGSRYLGTGADTDTCGELSESDVAKEFNAHHVHCFDAAEALAIYTGTADYRSPGTTEAATGPIRMGTARLNQVTDRIRVVDRQLDVLGNRLP